MEGQTSFLIGDIDPYTPRFDHNDFVGFCLDGPLRLHLPNGSKFTLSAEWMVYIPLAALGQAVEKMVRVGRDRDRDIGLGTPRGGVATIQDALVEGVSVFVPGDQDVPF